MIELIGARRRDNWWLLLYAAIGALTLFIVIISGKTFDLEVILYTFLGVPLISLAFALFLLARSIIRKKKPNKVEILMFPVYWAVTAILYLNHDDFRVRTRWLLHANELKADLQRQQAPDNGELSHIEFDGWGWAGMDTTEYLVFDPGDSLAKQVKVHTSGKFPGIPCEVPMVRRMQRNWYVVMYYTNAGWDQCM